MRNTSKKQPFLTAFERWLYGVSVTVIIVAFLGSAPSAPEDYMTLIASLVGATFLMLNAKGHVWGQILTVVFSVLYGILSYAMAYYGEMITYLGMTAPMAVISVISWARHPAEKGKHEVKVNHLHRREYFLLGGLSVLVTAVFYFLLKALGTGVLWLSTVSVMTSFIAAYLTLRRSEFYALGYAANDVVLMCLWGVACLEQRRYVSMVICFSVFLINDVYGFVNWSSMKRAQNRPK